MTSAHWEPGIGDPTVAGWVTAVVYFLTAFLCWRNRGQRGIEGRWWLMLAVLMTLLGFNKQLDLQTLFTDIGRDMARSEGWYQTRGKVQWDFIAGMLIAGSAAALLLIFTIGRHVGGWARFSILATCALGVWVLIRAASFHHVDEMLGMKWGGLRYNTILELGPLSLVALAAWRAGERDEYA